VLNFYNAGKLDIMGPDHIKNHIGRELIGIRDDISVSQYEEINPGSTVNMVLNDNEIKFPHPDLNLKDKSIIVNKFMIE
jgi:UDP-N-acetylglucosamine 2-epimerase (non-hydrolysing)